MNISHIDEAKKAIGDSTLALLKKIFDQSMGLPPTVPATRFRAKHSKSIDELHSLGQSGFLLKSDYSKDTYRVSALVLPLIESMKASHILSSIETVHKYFQRYYDEHLNQPISTNQIRDAVQIGREELQELLCYMRDVDGWLGGVSNNFPLEPDSTVIINEQILKYDSFGELISRAYNSNYVISARDPGGTTWFDQFHQSNGPLDHAEQHGRTAANSFGFESLLHPLIRKSSLQLFLDGHLREAVLNSVVAVFDFIRERTGLEDDGDRLIGKAFSIDDPFLVLSELSTESGANDQKGFMQIFKGAYQGVRNTKAHSLEHDLTKDKAAQYLIFASLLARRVEDAIPKKRADSGNG